MENLRETKSEAFTWHQAAPLKSSKRKALADLEYCITDPTKRVEYRVIKQGSQWEIQWGKPKE
tara:strand:+ start:965 stop:1153 length:189 start_codon:yes stop_codon:yes gene_type:complete